ncbi:MAG: hypothetical protein WCT48_01810 [Candidatus Paceibacterota bacterium]
MTDEKPAKKYKRYVIVRPFDWIYYVGEATSRENATKWAFRKNKKSWERQDGFVYFYTESDAVD